MIFVIKHVYLLPVLLAASFIDDEPLVPLTFDGVQGVFLLALGEKCGREAILLPRNPALAGIVNFGNVAAGGGDVSCFTEFDEWAAVNKTFDMNIGESD